MTYKDKGSYESSTPCIVNIWRTANTLLHMSSHWNKLQHNATHCSATLCTTLQHTLTNGAWCVCPYPQYYRRLLRRLNCNTLHHTATHSCEWRRVVMWICARISIGKGFFWCWCLIFVYMGWLRLVGSLELYVSFAKEHYKTDYLQKRLIILRSLLIVATPYLWMLWCWGTGTHTQICGARDMNGWVVLFSEFVWCSGLQWVAVCCNTLQHTASH